LVDVAKIKYVSGDETLLDSIDRLWAGLNQQHLDSSPDFKLYYKALTFEKRKVVLLQKARTGALRVELAKDEQAGQYVGYCVSSIDANKVGGIESLFVEEPYRGFGIGDALIKSALIWMDEKGAETKMVSVAAGNEEAFRFYARYGFRPRRTVLEQIKNH
jgi:ribosomal protein S18 acetylase RimI-like enzyme